MSGIWLHRFTVILAVCTLVLVAAGASVVSKEAGLSVPDWPLSYGKVMPEMKDGVFFEHGHRMIASSVGFLTIVLVAWVWAGDERRWMRNLALVGLAAVIVQGVLGGLTVLYLLPKAISISHACLAQLFFSLTVAMAMFTSPRWKQGAELVEDGGLPSLRSLAVATPIIVLSQLALGAAYRHKALGVMPHAIWAFVVALVVMLLATFVLSQYRAHAALRSWSWRLVWLTVGQVILGILAYLTRIMSNDAGVLDTRMVVLTVAHVAMGALVLATSIALSIQILRNVRTVTLTAHNPEGTPAMTGRQAS